MVPAWELGACSRCDRHVVRPGLQMLIVAWKAAWIKVYRPDERCGHWAMAGLASEVEIGRSSASMVG
jgi:hypothetical protein